MSEEQNEKRLQDQYMQLSEIDKRIREIKKELTRIDAQTDRIESIKRWIDEAQDSAGKDSLVPIADGIFIKAKLSEKKGFYVNVGSGVVVPKDADQTKKLLGEQLGELKDYQRQLNDNVSDLESMAQRIEDEFSQMG